MKSTKEAIIFVVVMAMFVGSSFLLGRYVGGREERIVSYDDPACNIYWTDGSMTRWFGSDFVLEPGESVTVPIPVGPEVVPVPEGGLPSIDAYLASILCQYQAAYALGIERELAELVSEYVAIQLKNRKDV